MSLILDALRQSKQQVGPVTQHDAPAAVSGAQTAQRPFVVLALLAGTIFGAGAVAVWQWGVPADQWFRRCLIDATDCGASTGSTALVSR